mmetsp:Transcript_8972/g.21812  ORF Transcript_8972/g.21812 Transcript_8972/m.21812 type:complete len:211 (+) Transcript_8972:177-809(+)
MICCNLNHKPDDLIPPQPVLQSNAVHLYFRPKLAVIHVTLSDVFLKVLHVHLSQLFLCIVIFLLIWPRIPWTENIRIHIRNGRGQLPSEYGILLPGGVSDSPIQDGIDATSRGIDRHSLSDAIRPARPAAVDNPRLGAVLLELVLEKFGVPRGMHGEEGGPEACAERGHGLSDSAFRACDLGGVSRNEMVHRLLGCELGDWWQDAECIAA